MTRSSIPLAPLPLAAIGAVGIGAGMRLSLGTLADMGPGMFPVIVSTALLATSLVIALVSRGAGNAAHPTGSRRVDVRVWACVLGGGIAFIGLAPSAGLSPAICVCVFVTSWADRSVRLPGVLALAICLTALGVALFGYALRVPLAILGAS